MALRTFEAWGETPEEMFTASAEATVNVMTSDLDAIARRTHRAVRLESEAFDMLLLNFLQEFIFYKDAERLLLRVADIEVELGEGRYSVSASASRWQVNMMSPGLQSKNGTRLMPWTVLVAALLPCLPSLKYGFVMDDWIFALSSSG